MAEIPVILLVKFGSSLPPETESCLNAHGMETLIVESLDLASATLGSIHCHLLMIDVRHFTEIQFRSLKRIKDQHPSLFVLGLTSATGCNSPVELCDSKVDGFLTYPIDIAALVEVALSRISLNRSELES